MIIANSASVRNRVWLLLSGLAMLALLAGCGGLPDEIIIPGITTPGTPTPNPTLAAIAQMLTATAAHPTAAPTSPPTFTPPPTPTGTATPIPAVQGQVGQPIHADTVGLTVLAASFRAELGGQPAAQGRVFLDLETVLENLSPLDGPSLPYTSYFFTLEDDAGALYSAHSFPQEAFHEGLPPRLLGGELLPGEMVRGHVTFEVPTEPGQLMLRFRPPAAGAGVTPPEIIVTLSQELGSIPNGGGSIPATGPASSEAWLSDALPGQDALASLNGVSLKIELARASGSFGGRRAPTGSRYLILSAYIRNDSRPRVPFNPQYFKVKDALGYEYPPVIFPGDELLQAGSLPEGQSVKGLVIFLIPADTERVGVIYKPQVLAEEWDAFRIAINVPPP